MIESIKDLRKTYIKNRKLMLEDFDLALKEVQLERPTEGGGKIGNMSYQQQSEASIFQLIIEQQEYIVYAEEYKLKYVILSEEKEILKNMIKKAKSIFKKEYDINMKKYL